MKKQRRNKEDNKIGKLQRTLKDRCPDCGGLLQLRIIPFSQLDEGEEITRDKKIKYCPNCEYSENIKEKLILQQDYDY